MSLLPGTPPDDQTAGERRLTAMAVIALVIGLILCLLRITNPFGG